MDTSTSEDVPPASRGKQSQSFELAGIKSEPGSDEVTAHVLCDSCTRLITKSRIIQEFMGTAEPEDAYTIWKRLRGGPRTESFSRSHALPSTEEFEASTACHLCSIIWHSLPRDAVEHGCGFLDATVAEDRSSDHVPVTFVVAPSDPTVAGSGTGSPTHEAWDVPIILKRYRGNVEAPAIVLSCSMWRAPEHHCKIGLLTSSLWNQGPLYPAGTSGSAPFLPNSTSSKESLTAARCWLRDCLEEHAECRTRSVSQTTNVPVKLPTRLIYVEEAQGQLAPRLVLTTASATLEDISYFTLSHSWSITTKETSLKLRTENIQQLQEAIPLEALPQTFRDAMDMTRRLGYRYIWIDSLCIIQDSHEDWEKEAVTMCDVYGNSTCTIAALGSNGMDCCYVYRNALSLFPCRVNMADDRIPVYAIFPDRNWDFDKTDRDSPVFQRGWVMQERLLSSRVIFTGHNQFHWECCHFRTNESFNFAFGSRPIMTQSPKLTFHALCDPQYCAAHVAGVADLAHMSLDRNMLELYSLWMGLLTDYTHMNLTYQSDKLVALAGIVDAVHASRGWTNVAGIWKEFWYLELLWRFDFDYPCRQRSLTQTGLRLPSWSWAATEEPKRFFNSLHIFNNISGGLWESKKTRFNDWYSGKLDRYEYSQAYSVAELVGFCGVPFSSQHSRSTTDPTTTIIVKGMMWRNIIEKNAFNSSSPSDEPFTIIGESWSDCRRTYKYSFDEIPSKDQVVYFLPLIISEKGEGGYRDQPCGLMLEPVPVGDAGTIKYWPPVPWQNDLGDLEETRIYVGSESYSFDDILHPDRGIGRGVEPTHYRRIGIFRLYLDFNVPLPGIWKNEDLQNRSLVYERTIHIV